MPCYKFFPQKLRQLFYTEDKTRKITALEIIETSQPPEELSKKENKIM
jgi:hypothetical protein